MSASAWSAFRAKRSRHLGLVLGGALVLPVRNLRFTLDGQGEVYRTPVAAGRGFAGVEVFLP